MRRLFEPYRFTSVRLLVVKESLKDKTMTTTTRRWMCGKRGPKSLQPKRIHVGIWCGVVGRRVDEGSVIHTDPDQKLSTSVLHRGCPHTRHFGLRREKGRKAGAN